MSQSLRELAHDGACSMWLYTAIQQPMLAKRHVVPICVQHQSSFPSSHQTLVTCSTISEPEKCCVDAGGPAAGGPEVDFVGDPGCFRG